MCSVKPLFCKTYFFLSNTRRDAPNVGVLDETNILKLSITHLNIMLLDLIFFSQHNFFFLRKLSTELNLNIKKRLLYYNIYQLF